MDALWGGPAYKFTSKIIFYQSLFPLESNAGRFR